VVNATVVHLFVRLRLTSLRALVVVRLKKLKRKGVSMPSKKGYGKKINFKKKKKKLMPKKK